MNPAIQVSELKKSYGSHIVLKGLNFQVEKGEVFSLLGVNVPRYEQKTLSIT